MWIESELDGHLHNLDHVYSLGLTMKGFEGNLPTNARGELLAVDPDMAVYAITASFPGGNTVELTRPEPEESARTRLRGIKDMMQTTHKIVDAADTAA